MAASWGNHPRRLGLEIDPNPSWIASLWLVNLNAPKDIPLHIGTFSYNLSKAAEQHIRWCASESYNQEEEFELSPRKRKKYGTTLSTQARQSLYVLMQAFNPKAIRNYLPFEVEISSIYNSAYPSHHGIRIHRNGKYVDLSMGPSCGKRWKRASISIKTINFDREVEPDRGCTGKLYVEKVWQEVIEALNE